MKSTRTLKLDPAFTMRLPSFILFLSVFTLALASACSGTKQSAEQPLASYQPAAQSTPTTEPVPSPQLLDVEAAVNRIFKDAAMVHPAYKNTFLTGDFNGDLSQDLAVVIKPAPEKITELNENPRWLLRDPRAPHSSSADLRVKKDEALLAVIHGYGPKAWRDPDPLQVKKTEEPPSIRALERSSTKRGDRDLLRVSEGRSEHQRRGDSSGGRLYAR